MRDILRDLSVIIPARNEMFLAQTVANVLENIEADTEVIAICDGDWPDPPLFDHPRLIVIHHDSIGQRAATNEGARLSQAKYVMKLDAHCAVGKGFDRILIEDCRRSNWTMIPSMHRLNAFEWKCEACMTMTGQGAPPEKCDKCQGTDFEMVVVWKPRKNDRASCTWRFDTDMNFQYWRGHNKRPEVKAQGDVVETMTCIGACFFMVRDRFWKLGGMDEKHGSWGNFGTELACKSWLSGGKMMTTKRTWFAHQFRTGNFRGAFEGSSTFPYPLKQTDVDSAKAYSRDLWLNDKWEGAKYPLSWLIDRFKPLPDWHKDKT